MSDGFQPSRWWFIVGPGDGVESALEGRRDLDAALAASLISGAAIEVRRGGPRIAVEVAPVKPIEAAGGARSRALPSWLLPLLIILVAVAFRFVLIDQIPPGYQHDENEYGLDALDVLNGKQAVWFERNVGREPIWIYLLALGYRLFGVHMLTQHALAATVGILTVAVTYPTIRLMFTRNVALLTTALVATSYWHVHISRIGFRVNTLPLLTTIAFGLFWWALQGTQRWRYAAAGAALGASLYTYYSARIVPAVPLLFVAYLLITQRRFVLQRWSHLAIYAVVGLIVFAPLGNYLVTHPAAAGDRVEQTVTLLPLLTRLDPGPFLTHAIRTLGMFSFAGDEIWRYNLAFRPVFDPLVSLFFVGGLLLAVRRVGRDPAHVFALLWLVCLLQPGMLTGESPHFLRTIGIIPAVYVFPALGLVWLGERLSRAGVSRRLLAIAALALLVFVGATTARDYFVVWANAEPVRVQFRADLTVLGRYLREHPVGGQKLISVEYPYDIDPYEVQFHLGGVMPEATWFHGGQALVVPAEGPVTYYIPGFASPPAGAIEQFLPGAELVDRFVESTGRESLRVYRVPAGPIAVAGGFHVPTPPASADASAGVDQAIDRSTLPLHFAGALLPQSITAGEPATAANLWQVDAPEQVARDQTFFLHLLGPWDSLWAQQDFSPYPPHQWHRGDRIITLHTVRTDPGTAPGMYRFVAGTYRRGTLERTPVPLGSATGPLQRSLALGEVPVERRSTASPVIALEEIPADVRFGDAVQLLSFAVDKPVAAPGEQLGVTLRWQALRGELPDYTVFVHLYDESGALRGQRDSQPVFGAYPTTGWSSGEVVLDHYDIPIPPDLPPGRYRPAIGIYSRQSGERLPVAGVAEGLRARLESFVERTPWGLAFRREGDRVLLGPITIRSVD